MKILTVLDSFGKKAGDEPKVYCYDVEGLVNEYEDFIVSKGHRLNCCQWLVTDSLPALYIPNVYYCTGNEIDLLNEYNDLRSDFK